MTPEITKQEYLDAIRDGVYLSIKEIGIIEISNAIANGTETAMEHN